MNQVVIPSPKMFTYRVTMATLKPHKSWGTFSYETFITENNNGLSWLLHCYCCYVSPVKWTQSCAPKACTFPCQAEDVWSRANVHGPHNSAARLQVCCLSLQPISSASTGDDTSSSMLVWAATNPLHSISLGHKFILQTNCSFSVGSSVFLISLLFTLLIQHHLSWPSKLWKADRRPAECWSAAPNPILTLILPFGTVSQ